MTKLPADLEAERCLIGTVLTGQPWEEAWDLESEDFYSPANAIIWETIKTLMSNGVTPDTLTLTDALMRQGELNKVGDLTYITKLDVNLPVLSNVKEWTRIVRDRATRRRTILKAQACIQGAANIEEDVQTVALTASAELAGVGERGVQGLRTASYGIEVMRERQERIQGGENAGLLPTGIEAYDHYLKGLTRGQLTIWGGFPGTGKTAVKSRAVLNFALRHIKPVSFELEDPIVAFLKRPLSQASRIQLRKLCNEKLTDAEMEEFYKGLEKLRPALDNIYIDQTPKLTGARMAAVIRQAVKRHGCQVAFIDNATEINHAANKMDRFDLDVDESIKPIRDAAIDLDIPIVLLVHFTNQGGVPMGLESRNVRPNNRMWRNSGGYEQRCRCAVGFWDNPDKPGWVASSVLKQQEGAKDFDFYIPFDTLTSLVRNMGREGPDGFDGSVFT